MSFAGRLVAGTVTVLILAVLVLVWSAEGSLRRDLERETAVGLRREAVLVTAALPADSLRWQETVRRLGTASGHRITIIDRAGRVRADSDYPVGPLPAIENHADRPEVQAALAGRTGEAERFSRTMGRPMVYVGMPGGPGVVRVAADLAQVDATVHRAQEAVLWGAVLAIAFGALIALATARSIVRPLTAITAAARTIAAGQPPRFPHSGVPDIDQLVQALRQMHGQLVDRFDQLRREQAETAALVDAMVEGVLAADARGRVVSANPAARQLLGYDPDVPLPDLRQLFRVKAAREVVDQVIQGDSVLGREVELDGQTVLMSARALPAGGAMLVLHNQTELRRLEAVRRDFVANVSHELKTPLTSISGYAETLLGESPDAGTTRRFLEVILSNARRMQRLVDSLLDLSRIESGGWRPRPEPLTVAVVARELWAGMAGRAGARRIAFDTEIAAGAETVFADADALRQVLTNLLDNALRYAPEGGRIFCAAARRTADDAGDGVAISIGDTGPGIPIEHLPRIFERFYRADPSRSREEGGTGLGLAIVKHLVEAHGGRVWAESEIGRGTVVTAWFPSQEPGVRSEE